MTKHRAVVQVVANRVPRRVLEEIYKISLPKPKSYEDQSRAPLASELLRAFCASRGYVASSDLPDETKAARLILKDYIDGKLPHFEMPPGIANDESDSSDPDDDASDDEEEEGRKVDMEHVMDDLKYFDISNEMPSDKGSAWRKPPKAAHKMHKKAPKSKNRSWRVENTEGDGMPVVRVFQKPANTGPLEVV